MKYRFSLILILLFLSVPIVSLCADAPPSTTPDPPATKQEQAQTNNTKPPPTSQPVSYDELITADLSTPEKSTTSFINLFNMIMPVTPEGYLQAICTKSATLSYQKNCLEVLETRLSYLKSIARKLKGALFKCQPPTQLGKSPIQIKAGWQEKLTFFDGSTKINQKSMTITLEKSGDDWKINKIE